MSQSDRRTYTVVLVYDEEDKVYNVDVPALPGCNTWGKTKRSAMKNATEAVELYVESLQDCGDPIPREILDFRQVGVSLKANHTTLGRRKAKGKRRSRSTGPTR